MRFVNALIKTRIRYIVTSIVTGTILSAVLYLLLNYYFYYKAQEGWFNSDANLILTSINSIAQISSREGEEQIRRNLEEFIKRARRSISISSISPSGDVLWVISGPKFTDSSRTKLTSHKELEIGQLRLAIDISKNNRPPVYLHLFRAVSFSILDYVESPAKYKEYRLIWRTIPWLVSLVVSLALMFAVFYIFRYKYRENLYLAETLENEKFKLMIENEKLRQNQKRWERQEESLSSVKARLEEEVTRKQSELEKMQARLQVYERETEKLAEAIDMYENEKATLEKAVIEYRTKLEACGPSNENSEACQKLQSELMHVEQLLAEYNAKHVKLEADKISLEANKNDYENRINQTSSSKSEIEHELQNIEYHLKEAHQRIKSLELERDSIVKEKTSVEGELMKVKDTQSKNAHIEYFFPNTNYTMSDIQIKLSLADFLKENDAQSIIYSDRYFYPKHATILSSLVQGKWLNSETSVKVTVPIDTSSENIIQKGDSFRDALERQRQKFPNFEIMVSNIDKKRFLHMRKLEVTRMDGRKCKLIFDVGMDFVRQQGSSYSTNQENYVVIQEG